MKQALLAAVLGCALLFAPRVQAQTPVGWSSWAYGDASPGSIGAEAGFNYGGSVTFGLAAGVFHPYRLSSITPEAEVYAGMTAELGTYILWVYVGGGVYTDPTTTWTGRASLWFIDTRPVGLFASLYGMWTPSQGSTTEAFLVQPRIGMEIKVGRRLQVVPYLQIALPISTDHRFSGDDISVAPGVLGLWSW